MRRALAAARTHCSSILAPGLGPMMQLCARTPSLLLAAAAHARLPHTPRSLRTLEWISSDGLSLPCTREVKAGLGAAADSRQFSEAATKPLLHDVRIVTTLEEAEEAAATLLQLKDVYHAIDTEVADIDVVKETPVGHGSIICFSVFCGREADFGGGTTRLWVDVLKGGKAVLNAFKPYLESESIPKVWHNYAFDRHIFENEGIYPAGFGGDTMHMARLWDSSRTGKGYSLESLTSDAIVMKEALDSDGSDIRSKLSMKELFGIANKKKDGEDGKLRVLPDIKVLQDGPERARWIDYSTLDAEATWNLRESLESKLRNMPADASQYITYPGDGSFRECSTMWEFYELYWKPFGALLVKMEGEGMLVDSAQLKVAEKEAMRHQEEAEATFRTWASLRCEDARLMNVGSGAQVRQLLFAGHRAKGKGDAEQVPLQRAFKVPNPDWMTWSAGSHEDKAPPKQKTITLSSIVKEPLEPVEYTASGLPSVSSIVLRSLVGKSGSAGELLKRWDAAASSETWSAERPRLEQEVDTFCQNLKKAESGMTLPAAFGGGREGLAAAAAIDALCEASAVATLLSGFILPLQGSNLRGRGGRRVHCSLNINTETGRLSARRPNLQNQPALEKDRYGIRKAFTCEEGNALIVADYGQLELRLLAHMANCKSMLEAFELGGDFHSRTALGMYPHIREAIDNGSCLLEYDGLDDKPPLPLLKDKFASERRKAKILNFSIAYGKTKHGLSRDWNVSLLEAEKTVNAWYGDRPEVKQWQEEQHRLVQMRGWVSTLLGRQRRLPEAKDLSASRAAKAHALRAAINTPIQGGAADIAMLAMLELEKSKELKEMQWRLLMQVHDEVILEGPKEHAEAALTEVRRAMQHPFNGRNLLRCALEVSSSFADSWYAAK